MQVFVCHASEDKPRVRQLCQRLRADGIEIWLDEEKLLPGQDWEMEISAAVRASDAILVCLSRSSVEKVGYLQKELRRVLDFAEYQPEGRIFVIPVRLEECPVPVRLSRWQYADLFAGNGYERLRQSLLAGVAQRDRVPPPAEDAPPLLPGGEPARPGIRKTGWAVALVAMLVAGAATIALWKRSPNPGPAPNKEVVPAGMVPVPGGHFLMGRSGDPEASPAHEVEVKPFYMDAESVTIARFAGFLRASNRASEWTGGDAAGADGNLPATRVTWDEAAAYCLAQGKRLPTEAEWEFAARGTDGRLYPWGEVFDPSAVNALEAGLGRPEPAGGRPLNRSPYGVRDMSGNVWQWCADDYRPYPGHTPGFAIPPQAKVIRGGSFQSDRLHVTAITRNLEVPSRRSPAIGFRCAK